MRRTLTGLVAVAAFALSAPALAADPAAIGYVASTTPLPRGVKVVNIITQ